MINPLSQMFQRPMTTQAMMAQRGMGLMSGQQYQQQMRGAQVGPAGNTAGKTFYPAQNQLTIGGQAMAPGSLGGQEGVQRAADYNRTYATNPALANQTADPEGFARTQAINHNSGTNSSYSMPGYQHRSRQIANARPGQVGIPGYGNVYRNPLAQMMGGY